MSKQLQSPVSLVTLVKTEPPTVIKNEPLDTNIKEIDIVYHSLCEDLIKSETVLEDMLENKYLESVQTQALMKAENSPFIKTENITRRASNEHSNALSNLETDEQHVLTFSKKLNGISVRSRKSKSSKSPKKTEFSECYKTDDTTLWEKEKEKIKVINAHVIPVEAHEYTSLANDRHVCNHCQHVCNRLNNLKLHIKGMHREVTTMYQCSYCPYKSKYNLIKRHINLKHKYTKDIQWFQCHLCEKKFKLKSNLTQHMKVHLTHEQMQDLKRHHCDQCDYKTDRSTTLKAHKIIHLKPEEIEYFYCYHCSYKSKQKFSIKNHIFSRHFKHIKQEKRHHCDRCDYKSYSSAHFKMHKLIHLKPEDISYFHCYHCSYKSKQKANLQRHILQHLNNGEVKFDCYICNFMTQKRESIIEHIKKHSKVQIKFEINEGS